MIAAVLAFAAAALLAVGYLASVPALGWVALAVAVAAAVLVVLPTLRGEPGPGVDPRLLDERPVEENADEPVEVRAVLPAAVPVVDRAGDLVLVSPGRRRYHRSDCDLLADLEVEQLTEGEAREEGFSACTRCAK